MKRYTPKVCSTRHVQDAPFSLYGQSCRIGVSIGIAGAGDTSTPDDLLHEADTALYRAKAAGRNTYRIFTQDPGGPDTGTGLPSASFPRSMTARLTA